MKQPVFDSIRALRVQDPLRIESLFHSEEIYWLTMSISTGFALSEVQRAEERAMTERENETMLEAFETALRLDHISQEITIKSHERTLSNIDAIDTILRENIVFNAKKAVYICAAFLSYWLFTKLIEIEWQTILEKEEIKDSYMFLDGVIADQSELAIIKEKILTDSPLHDDEIIYLRSHWLHAKSFFARLRNTAYLLDQKLITFVGDVPSDI